jgi:ATP-binding cassette subfamily F protein uup
VGGYDDWLRQRREPATPKEPKPAKKEEQPARERPAPAKRKVSFKEARELEALPQRIEALETEESEIIAALNSPAFYAGSDSAQVASTNARLEALQLELDEAYSRWEQLEDLGN